MTSAPGMDSDTIASIFSQQRDRLRRTVMVRMDARLLGRVDAEDVLQESYLAAVQRAHHYRADASSPFVWVRIVVVQTLVDVARRHLGAGRRSAMREVSMLVGASGSTSNGLLRTLVRTGTTPSGAAARGEQAARLHTAIAAMSSVDQEVLALRHFEELSNGEVAEILGIHKAAATNRYLRALQRLRVVLNESDERRRVE